MIGQVVLLGDRVQFYWTGLRHNGIIVEIIEHKMLGQPNTSIRIQSDRFSTPVIINITLFPYRVKTLESNGKTKIK